MVDNFPRITVVTPSFNQAQFLEQTILSVIGQRYPNLEYIIMDGGSKDGSVEIIKKYQSEIAYWVSEKDNGQAAAINKGFSIATGDIFCWLNSDDMLMPGALLKIGGLFKTAQHPTIIFGNCLHFHEDSPKTRGSDVVQSHECLDLKLCDYIIQPSSFWNKSAWKEVGILNEQYHYTFDWEWFLRAEKAGVSFSPCSEYLSLYRIHDQHKSGTGGDKRAIELGKIYREYNDANAEKAFLKWSRISSGSKFLHDVIYTVNKQEISFLNRAIHFLLFPMVPFRAFKQIVRM